MSGQQSQTQSSNALEALLVPVDWQYFSQLPKLVMSRILGSVEIQPSAMKPRHLSPPSNFTVPIPSGHGTFSMKCPSFDTCRICILFDLLSAEHDLISTVEL